MTSTEDENLQEPRAEPASEPPQKTEAKPDAPAWPAGAMRGIDGEPFRIGQSRMG